MSDTPTADDRLELRPGARPLPDYELVARLGRGGFGEVWKAVGPGRVPVALKFIALDQGAGAVEQKALDLMLEVRHAHLLDLHGHWQRHGHLILAMSLADGTLLDRLGQITAHGQPGLPIDELLPYLEEAAKGLDFLAGRRMQHRDVKPGNLLLVGGSVKVADYGLARVLEKSVSDTKGGFTLAYAAPELVNQQVSLKVDQYALAVSYCQLRANRLPFGGSPQQVMIGHLMHAPDLSMLPEAERPAVARALAKKPDDRWPTCLAFVQALRQQTAPAGPPSATPGPQAARNTVSPAEACVTTRSAPASDRPPEAPATWQQQPTLTRAPHGRRWWWLGLTAAVLMAVVGVGLRTLLPVSGPSTAATDPEPPPVKQPPELLAAPFNATQARDAQQAWAGYLKVEPVKTIPLGGGVELVLVLIPPGRYRRGSPDEDRDAEVEEKPRRAVTITRPFYLGRTEVTRGQFRRFVQAKGYRTEAESDGTGAYGWHEQEGGFKQDPGLTWGNAGFPQADDHPVVNVSWNDATAFVGWLREPAQGDFGLPREAEWEYAARAGTTARYLNGDDAEGLAALGNVADASLKRRVPNWPHETLTAEDGHAFTAPAGQFPANAFGLHDMTGNVWEWCQDWYDKDYYGGSDVEDPRGPPTGDSRVLRGGSWDYRPVGCRVAFRNRFAPALRGNGAGFRVLLRLD